MNPLSSSVLLDLLDPASIPRPRLVERLNESLARGDKLTLIFASAGFGKTTLVSEWVARCEQPMAWLSLDEGDHESSAIHLLFVSYHEELRETLPEPVIELLSDPLL